MNRRFYKIALAVLAALSLPISARAQDASIPAFKDVDSMEARVQGCVTCTSTTS
jgi:hypothetical protein